MSDRAPVQAAALLATTPAYVTTGSRPLHTRRCARSSTWRLPLIRQAYDDNAKYSATIWAVSGAAQNDDATGWSEAYRGRRGTRPLPDHPRRRSERRHRCALAPHFAKPDGDVDPGEGAGGLFIRVGGKRRAVDAGKQPEDFVRQKARSRRDDMAATMPALLHSIKPPRLHQIEVIRLHAR